MNNIIKIIALALLSTSLAFTNNNKKIIVIDVSHGGSDNGISIGELNEKEITLKIAKKIRELNKNANVELILTRDSDKFITLNERIDCINKLRPDFVISLHLNENQDENQNGTEILVCNKNRHKAKSNKLAQDIYNSFDKEKIKINEADFYLLKKVHFPIVLIELGYLTNEKERLFLSSEKGQLEIATSLLKVIN